ncbi:FAD binding domain-containing protein [Streptomyces sp. ODS28]|uniref:FAD binding domain-containing protein n=1 Tax=Streptomyces sp. ODS28 TaxID=3136688 RepID=UPI0031ECDA24
MKPPVFAYLAPQHLDEALELAARGGDRTAPLAGGQSLVPLLNHRRLRPAAVLDLNRLRGLDTVTYETEEPPPVRNGATRNGATGNGETGRDLVRIGALARLRTLERDARLAAALPVLRETVRLVAHPQIRSRSTLGGSLCHADPAAELPALALALGARLRLSSLGGERVEEAADFYRPGGATSRRPDELLTAVDLPLDPGFRFRFEEVTRAGQDGFPLVGVCLGVRCAEDGTVTAARLAAAGVADRPLRLADAERELRGQRLAALAAGELPAVLEAAADGSAPRSDHHGSADYRRALLRTVVRRAAAHLAETAGHSVRGGEAE